MESLPNVVRPRRRLVLQLTAMAAASLALPRALDAQQASAEAANALPDGIETFEGVWQTVRDRFYDPNLNGLDWSAVRE
ncbi:MAG: Tricorn protease domain, partial [Acetobacteraceae bacterium]|nr:Tricorn protease domain [Acetobacteraceae bacterium]